GSGSVILTGANTYAGGTLIAQGSLSIASDSELGKPGTGVTLAGGALLASETFATSRPFTLSDNGSFLVDAGKVLNLNGTISGGLLTKVGPGELALTNNNNNYKANFVRGGQLTGNSGSIRGNIALDTNANNPPRSVDFSQGVDGTFAGLISGGGSV